MAGIAAAVGTIGSAQQTGKGEIMGIGNFVERVGRVSQGWNAAEDEKRVRARAEMQDQINAYGLADLERQRAERESERAAIQAAVQANPNIDPTGLALVAQRVRAQRGDFEGVKRLGDPKVEELQRQSKLYELELENDPELRAAKLEIMRGQIPQLRAESKMKLVELGNKSLNTFLEMYIRDPEGATQFASESGVLFPGRKISKAGMTEIGGKKMFVFVGEDGKPLGAMPEAEVKRRIYGEKKAEVIKYGADEGVMRVSPDGSVTEIRAPQPDAAKTPAEIQLIERIQSDPDFAEAYQKAQGMKGKTRGERIEAIAADLLAKNGFRYAKTGTQGALTDATAIVDAAGGAKPTAASPKSNASGVASLPAGSKKIGTAGGKPVYQTPDGKRFIGQ